MSNIQLSSPRSLPLLLAASWLTVACAHASRQIPASRALPAPEQEAPSPRSALRTSCEDGSASSEGEDHGADEAAVVVDLDDAAWLGCGAPSTRGEWPLFQFDSTTLRAHGEVTLDRLANCMQQGALKTSPVRIAGYADPRGAERYNLKLGFERASAARDYLVRQGVSPARLSIRSFGEDAAMGTGAASFRLDRRVEMHSVLASTKPAVAPSDADRQLATAVAHKLARVSLRSSPIEVSVTHGVVSLVGYVDDALLSQRAVQAALTLRGVRAVIDRLQVPDTGEGPLAIENGLSAALSESKTVEAYELGTSVRGHTVRLSGVVQSHAEREAAEDLAFSVRGVERVDNSIRVAFERTRADREIASDVERQLATDPYLSENPIRVEVAQRIVVLSGSVGSEFEKQRATRRAMVVGVRRIQAQALRVAPTVQDCLEYQHEPHPGAGPIAHALADALELDPRVGSHRLRVVAQGRSVTLTGTVFSAGARRAAEQDARDTLGVARVDNRIAIAGGSL